MKKLNEEQMQKLHGGMHYTWQQHAGCFLAGVAIGGGILGAAGYASCMLLYY